MIVSPDEGALNRNMYYASVLGVLSIKRKFSCLIERITSCVIAEETAISTLDVYKRQLTNRAKKRMLIYRVISNLERSACR